MIGREGIAIGVIHREDADDPVQTLQRHDEGGLKKSVLSGVGGVSCLNLWIAIYDWPGIFSDPTAQSFSDSDFKGRQRTEILTADELRQQPAIAIHEDGDGVVRNHL